MDKQYDLTEAGLEFGLIFADYCWNTKWLHYGFFTNGLEPLPQNVKEAQENYAQFLLSQFPSGVKRILDVGCGSGLFAKKMIAMGYEVDVVSPGRFLTEQVRANLAGTQARIFNSGYEEAQAPAGYYDMILFSESFQYIDVEKAFANNAKFLKPQGHVVICDFFQRSGVPGKSPIGGGHNWEAFCATMKNQPFELEKDQDITAETAPSLDVVDDFLTRFMVPISLLVVRILRYKLPWMVKFIEWKFAKKIEKAKYKYFQRNSNGAQFAKYKTYRLLRYRLKP